MKSVEKGGGKAKLGFTLEMDAEKMVSMSYGGKKTNMVGERLKKK